MADIPPALRALLDRELSSAVESLLCMAAEHDGEDLIEANVSLMQELLDLFNPAQLAAAAAAMALKAHRADRGDG